MKIRKLNFVSFIVLIGLVFGAAICIYHYLSSESEDVREARNFINMLYDIDALKLDDDLSNMTYKTSKIVNDNGGIVHRTVSTSNYGIDFDKDSNIIGFAKKDIGPCEMKLSVEEAEVQAEEYLKSICDEEIMLKESKNNDNSPDYIFIFTKAQDGHEFYFDEIKLSINKETGFLDAYSNTAINRQYVTKEIEMSQTEAENNACEIFNKYNLQGRVSGNAELVYSDNKIENSDGIAELCYMINVTGVDVKGSEITWKLFINANDNTLFNIVKNGEEKEVRTT